MPIQDNDSERRNLTTTSVAFIAYYVADGKFEDGVVNLSVINATFLNTGALAIMAWIILIWFFYRYWVTHDGEFTKTYWKEISDYQTEAGVRDYFTKKLGTGRNQTLLALNKQEQDDVTEKGWVIRNIIRDDMNNGKTSIFAEYATNAQRDENGHVSELNKSGELDAIRRAARGDNLTYTVELEGLGGWWLLTKINIKYCFEMRTFGDYIVPYILFGLAIVHAAYSCWLPY